MTSQLEVGKVKKLLLLAAIVAIVLVAAGLP